ncbi:hypothetical protein SDC9_120631 [bioreactor metagenome]|uniref:Uncharacterized protein n=1 Tax=bioreactor metagenome TaxID=1076179 RepID=A0A645C7M1_9ZZZZ
MAYHRPCIFPFFESYGGQCAAFCLSGNGNHSAVGYFGDLSEHKLQNLLADAVGLPGAGPYFRFKHHRDRSRIEIGNVIGTDALSQNHREDEYGKGNDDGQAFVEHYPTQQHLVPVFNFIE